jgi:hypothetical protein
LAGALTRNQEGGYERSDASWQKSAQLLINDELMREAPLGEFLWYIFSTLFITVDSSPTFVPWAARSPPFTDRPATIPESNTDNNQLWAVTAAISEKFE